MQAGYGFGVLLWRGWGIMKERFAFCIKLSIFPLAPMERLS
jgi:hypothetical protein